MRMGEALLTAFFPENKNIRRSSWPEGDYISSDGADGGTIWYYDASEDELTAGYRFGFHDLATDEWEILG